MGGIKRTMPGLALAFWKVPGTQALSLYQPILHSEFHINPVFTLPSLGKTKRPSGPGGRHLGPLGSNIWLCSSREVYTLRAGQ